MQSQTHLHMRDNGHGNLENGNSSSSSNAESSSQVTTKSSKPKSSLQVPTSSATSTSTGTSGPHTQSSRKHSYTHGMTNDNENKPNSPTSPNIDKNQFLLEQQIKMTQLQQLQQLQNHIFQQQMALISGQSTPVSNILPTSSESIGMRGVGSVGAPINGPGAVVLPLRSIHDGEQNLSQNLQSRGGETQIGPHTFSGLLTPAPSGEIRPMDYTTTSPMMNLIGSLNLQHIEPLPISMIPSSHSSTRSLQHSNIPHLSSNISQRYGHKHSSSLSLPSGHLPNNRQSHASYPSSPSTFNQVSPTFHPNSPMHLPISHPYHRPSKSSRVIPPQSQMQAAWHSHPSSSPATPLSAPSDSVEFSIYGVDTNGNEGSLHATPHLHSSNSVHTSPSILGSINGPSGGFGHRQQLLDLDQDISPLMSPWLGATVSGSGGTAVSTSAHVAPNALVEKVEASKAHARRTSVSGVKRTASESGDEGDDAWSRGGTNRNSRKRPVLGRGERTGSLSGSVGSNAAATPGLVGGEKAKGGENDDGRNGGSTSPLMRNSTSPASEVVSSPTSMTRDPSAREAGGGGGHLNGASSDAPATPLVTGSSRRMRRGSRATSTTSTPLLKSPPSTTNLLSPMSPFLGVGGTASGSRSNRLGGGGQGQGQGQGQELNSPSPVDMGLEIGQGQDGKSGRNMPPPPLPRGGVDVDMNSTSPMDDSTGHLRGEMLGMGGMGFDSMMSLDDGMNVGMVGMGMGDLGGMGMGMSGMDMESMGGIGGMGMEEMGVDMGMSVNMGGMGGFGNGHEDSHHLQQQRREELGMIDMGYGRDHDEEGTHISSSSSSASASAAGMSLATHQHRLPSHLQPRSQYRQLQPHHLSPAQTQQHLQPLSNQHSLPPPQMHDLPTEQSQHQLQDQLGQSITGNQPNQQQPIMPVATPSSILNLGRIGGGRLGSALSASTPVGVGNAASGGDGTGVVPRVKRLSKASKDAGGSNGGRKGSMITSMVGPPTAVGRSPALKPLRPVAIASESALPSPVLTGSIGSSSSNSKASLSGVSSLGAAAVGLTGGGSISATPSLSPADAIGVIRQPKRTHRDAEQRRRNSQKQVIDELRRLLPPIALPSDSNANNGDSDLTSLGLPGTSPFFFQPTATLLPGSLPPRGPPKAGGEGPNKNVSKLQVLLCGNEYIKLLKARVERRDEEIGRLRREVTRLRGGGLVGDEDEEVDLDLEKDLDAVERLQMMTGKGAGSSESSMQGRGSSMGRGGSGNDAMDEEDEDGDD